MVTWGNKDRTLVSSGERPRSKDDALVRRVTPGYVVAIVFCIDHHYFICLILTSMSIIILHMFNIDVGVVDLMACR